MKSDRAILSPLRISSTISSTGVALVFGALGATALISSSAAQRSAGKYRPTKVEIAPNAIQDVRRPMTLRIKGSKGQTMHLFVLQSCDNDPSTPELRGTSKCKSPLWQQTVTLDQYGRYRDKLDLRKLGNLPHDKPLWLRVSASRSGRRAKTDRMFAIAKNPCGVWRTVLGGFGRGQCHAGVSDLFTPQRGALEELPREPLHVRRLDMDKFLAGDRDGALSIVPGTSGVSGVAWWDASTLLITTRASSAGHSEQATDKPGVYRVDVATGKRTLLYESPAETVASAPFAVNGTCAVFVEDTVNQRAEGPVSQLVIWDSGREPRRQPLQRSIHQFLGVDRQNRALLAYSLWNRTPTLVRIAMADGQSIDLGSDSRLLHAAFRSPRDPLAVLAQKSKTSTRRGWELALMDETGALKHEVAVGPGHDLLPAWRPDGAELVFLGQVKR